MIPDDLLRQAAARSSQVFVNSVEQDYDPDQPHQFPPEFERKIKKLASRANHPYLRRVPRRIASILLAAALSGSLLLGVNTEARAAFFGWVRETVNTWAVYRSVGTSRVPGAPRGYELTWIPEGYSEWETAKTGETVSVVYADEFDHFLSFDYAPDSDDTAWFIDTSNTTQYQVLVNGRPAQLLLSHDPGTSSAILWTDEYNTIFCISAFFSEEDLIRLAESVQKIF